ncbi:recombinase family protein [Bradyrhizobium pachyrhizi]|uniref:recombinase family protein n=1 Tax=Bradyrhizobium pachyrhizi TaxID=280333 RepID=UPI003D35D327
MANSLVVRKGTSLAERHRALRAAQYVRMSTERQQYSIQNQASVIATFAHAHNLTIVETYRDEGESGLQLKNRAGLIRLIEDVQSGKADFGHILVYDVSRWGRFQDTDESAHYEFICKQAGIKVAYCAEQFDNDGSMLSSIVKNIKRVMAAEYSRELSAKIFAGQCRFARLGYMPGGLPSYGLARELVDQERRSKGLLKKGDLKYLTTDHIRVRPGPPEEVAIVRWMFQRFLEVKSESLIAWELNNKNIPAGKGGCWACSSVTRILKNERYIGNLIFNQRSNKLRRGLKKNPPEEWIRADGCIEPIIDHDTFRKVGKIIEERRVDLTDEEMLKRFRKVLHKEGRLSPRLIDRTVGLPCIATVRAHFGTVRNLYRLIGYTPKRNYGYLDTRALWAEARSKLTSKIAYAIAKAGCRTVPGGWTNCLRVVGSETISVRTARWIPRPKEQYSERWSIEREVHLPAGWIAAIRLSQSNTSPLDYVLLPTDGRTKYTIRFSESTRERRGIVRFKTEEALIRAITRRVARKGRSYPASPKRWRTAGRHGTKNGRAPH